MPAFLTEPSTQWLIASAVLSVVFVAVAWFVSRRLFEPDSFGRRLTLRLALLVGVIGTGLAVLWELGIDVPKVLDTAGNTPLWSISGQQITAFTIAVFLVLLVLSWYGSVFARRGISRALRARQIGDPGTVASVARLAQYAVAALGIAVSLETIGIDLGALVTAGAVFAVGIGFAMQNIAQNFVSGVILLAERSISPGDIVEVEGHMVRIRVLGIRSTIASTLDDEELIIPNSFLVQSNVKNFTLNDTSLRVRLVVGVAYESDLDVVLRALEKAAHEMESRLKTRDPVIALLGFGSSSVDFEVSIWSADPWQKLRMRSDLAFAVWNALKAQGITIAFPQLDVHFDESVAPMSAARDAGSPGEKGQAAAG